MATTLNQLMDINAVNQLIANKHKLVITADEPVLRQLQKGDWIGGTIPYFMDIHGGCTDQQKVFVTDLTDKITGLKLASYDADHIGKMLSDRNNNGFTYLMMPCFSGLSSNSR